VIKYCFGRDWLDEHLDPEGPDGFLRQMPDDEAAQNMQAYRILDLAELLFNLQDTDGFANCIERMKNGDIEGTYAGLDFGRMLHMHGVKFRFVAPLGKKGSDYDIEIECTDGLTICADAKCKIQSTEFSLKTISNTLHDARTQFPADRPSAIFVKMPPHWTKDEERSLEVFDVAHEFLRQTKRIVSVKFYVDHLFHNSGVITHVQAFKLQWHPPVSAVTLEWNKSPSSWSGVENREDLMDRTTRCPKCEKRMVPVVTISGRTDLQCISCDDPAVKWSESPLTAPEKPIVLERV
jgi:hypothetical protein